MEYCVCISATCVCQQTMSDRNGISAQHAQDDSTKINPRTEMDTPTTTRHDHNRNSNFNPSNEDGSRTGWCPYNQQCRVMETCASSYRRTRHLNPSAPSCFFSLSLSSTSVCQRRRSVCVRSGPPHCEVVLELAVRVIWMVCQEMRCNWNECAMLSTEEEQTCGGKRVLNVTGWRRKGSCPTRPTHPAMTFNTTVEQLR